jgi:hypothetical protein
MNMASMRVSPLRAGLAILIALLAPTVLSIALAWAPVDNSSAPADSTGAISGTVIYAGHVTGTHMIWVGAFTPTQNGPPVASVTLGGPGPYTMTSVPAGVYNIMAGLDVTDTDGPPNPSIDPMGAFAHNPVTVTAGGMITNIDITLLDPATGSVSGWITYTGHITTPNNVIVYASRAGEQGPPAYHAIISGPGPYTITNMAAYTYTVAAYMDLGNDMQPPQPDEPFGWYDLGNDNVPDQIVVGSGPITDINITLRDPTPPSGSIAGRTSYAGAITGTHNIVILASRWGEQGPPAYFTVTYGTGPYTISQVADYTYTLAAFMDRDGDMGQPKPDEPVGWYDPNGDKSPDPVIVVGGVAVTDINIALRDPYAVYLPVMLR